MVSTVVDELVTMTDVDVVERFRELELTHRRIEAEQALLVAAMDARSIAQKDGHRSINAMLRAELNCSTAEAAAMRSLARTIDRFECVGGAWIEGRIRGGQVKHIARARGNHRVVDRLGPFVPIFVEQAEILDSKDFGDLVDETVRRLDEEGAHDARDAAIEHRNAHVSVVGDGLAVNAFGGDPLAAEEVVAIFDAFVEAEYRTDVEARRRRHADNADFHDLARTGRQRRFDALCEIFRMAAVSGGAPIAPQLVLNIVTDARTFADISQSAGLAAETNIAGEQVDPFTGLARPDSLIDELMHDPASLLDRRCETASGVPLHAHDVLRAALSGHVRRVVVDAKGVVVDMGRKQRLYTGSAREAAKLLIKRCEHPGCRLPVRFCDVDHADEWDRDAGRTDQANSGVRCGPHNRAKTRHRWRTRRATNGATYTIREDGTIMLPIGARRPTFDDEPSGDDRSHEVIDHLVDDITWDQLVTRVKHHTLEYLLDQRRRERHRAR